VPSIGVGANKSLKLNLNQLFILKLSVTSELCGMRVNGVRAGNNFEAIFAQWNSSSSALSEVELSACYGFFQWLC
jgi:hypothetical protein